MKRLAAGEGIAFAAAALLPATWQHLRELGPIRTFNPGLLRLPDGWLMAYRLVGGDGQRRLATCRLDEAFQVAPGSPAPLSDGFRFRDTTRYPEIVGHWFADPRLYRFGGRIFVYWNSGWHEPQNHQFLHELDAVSLRPIGTARELLLVTGQRRQLEKNWTLFGPDPDDLRVLYSLTPHCILRCSLAGEGDVACRADSTQEFLLPGYPPCHGGLRGGAPPVRVGDRYWVFGHSVHDSPAGYRYAALAYSFSADAGHAPLDRPIRPLQVWNPYGGDRLHPALNPAVGEVIYPCGAVWHEDGWILGYGLNDERCAVMALPAAEVAASCRQPAG